MAMSATIWNKNHTETNEYTDVSLCPAGVIISAGLHTQILVPFASGRVHEVFSYTPGEIALELGQ